MNTKEFRKTLKLIKAEHGDSLPIFLHTDHGQEYERLTDFEVCRYEIDVDGEILLYDIREFLDEKANNQLPKCIVLYGD